MNDRQPRNELKYFINTADAALLETRLRAALRPDPHAADEKGYFIRSLYFDDLSDSSYFDKLQGVAERTKYRLRFYNRDPSFIRLEKKEKKGDQILKSAETVSRSLAEQIVSGDVSELLRLDKPLLREFASLCKTEGWRPVFFVDYCRKAFLHPVGDTRITLDRELKARRFSGSLFEASGPSVPILEASQTILEVKFNHFLLPHVKDLLSDIPLERSAISKFCICRQAL